MFNEFFLIYYKLFKCFHLPVKKIKKVYRNVGIKTQVTHIEKEIRQYVGKEVLRRNDTNGEEYEIYFYATKIKSTNNNY